jgi:hypothetical protein
MKNHTFSFSQITATLLLFMLFFSQAGIAQNIDNNSLQSIQDTSSQNKVRTPDNGKLLLNVALKGTNDNTTIKGTTTNLLIYNTATAGVSPFNVYPGYYSNAGTTAQPNWKRVEAKVKEAVKNN